MPLGGESGLGMVSVGSASGTSDWEAGQESPTSSGTLTLSQGTAGSIDGSVDATLAPMKGSSTPLHISGGWTC